MSDKSVSNEQRIALLEARCGTLEANSALSLNLPQHYDNQVSSDQPITSGISAPIAMATRSGSAVPFIVPGSGRYRLEGLLWCKQGATANTQTWGLSASHLTSSTRVRAFQYAVGLGQAVQVQNVIDTTGQIVTNTGGGFGINAIFCIDLKGELVFSAADSFQLAAWEGGGATSWTILAGSWMDIWPIF